MFYLNNRSFADHFVLVLFGNFVSTCVTQNDFKVIQTKNSLPDAIKNYDFFFSSSGGKVSYGLLNIDTPY